MTYDILGELAKITIWGGAYSIGLGFFVGFFVNMLFSTGILKLRKK